MRIKLNRRTALLLAELCQQAYQPQGDVHLPGNSLQLSKFVYDDRTDATAIVAVSEMHIFVAIKGSSTVKDFLTDASILKKDYLFGEKGKVKIHSGFLEDFVALRNEIRMTVAMLLAAQPTRELWITGHSLGAAIACLVATDLATSGMHPAIYTFGCPRIGNRAFAKLFNKLVPHSFRVAHDMDIVTRVPKLFYWHVNRLFHMNEAGKRIRIGSFLGFLKGLFWRVTAAVDGEGIRDHFIQNYIDALRSSISKDLPV